MCTRYPTAGTHGMPHSTHATQSESNYTSTKRAYGASANASALVARKRREQLVALHVSRQLTHVALGHLDASTHARGQRGLATELGHLVELLVLVLAQREVGVAHIPGRVVVHLGLRRARGQAARAYAARPAQGVEQDLELALVGHLNALQHALHLLHGVGALTCGQRQQVAVARRLPEDVRADLPDLPPQGGNRACG